MGGIELLEQIHFSNLVCHDYMRQEPYWVFDFVGFKGDNTGHSLHNCLFKAHVSICLPPLITTDYHPAKYATCSNLFLDH